MVAGRRILAGEDDVAEPLGLRLHLGMVVFPIKRPGPRRRLGDVEPPGMGFIAEPPRALVGRQGATGAGIDGAIGRPEEHTSELQSLMRHSYAGFCLEKKKYQK